MIETYSVDGLLKWGPHGFRRAVQRLMAQNKFVSFSVDGAGDGGGDLICERDGQNWLIQCKWKSKGLVSKTALNEVQSARVLYNAHHCIVATNTIFSRDFLAKVDSLKSSLTPVVSWDGETLAQFASNSDPILPAKDLRPYQLEAVQAIESDLHTNNRALLYLATGLGKTVVAGSVIRKLFHAKPGSRVLVLAHMVDLVDQLERALWSDLPLSVPTQQITSGTKGVDLPGLVVATNLSAEAFLDQGYQPDLVVIDECHHVGGDNAYSRILRRLKHVPTLGVTATPWRGDGYAITEAFGKPSFVCGIEDGMKKGYLAPVDYHLFCDNVDWDAIPSLSRYSYSIGDLNKKLFIPQRDSQIIDALSEHWVKVRNPKCIIFCQSIEHAKTLHSMVKRYERWQNAEILHSEISKNERRFSLLKFRGPSCPMLIAVDILNEGVDVPDVNVICFARVTHSRKIFVQQLGRGLRLAEGKEKVTVLDFAADTRRLAAIHALQANIERSNIEQLEVKNNTIIFSDQRAKSLIEEWIKDAANLEDLDSESRLQFPRSI